MNLNLATINTKIWLNLHQVFFAVVNFENKKILEKMFGFFNTLNLNWVI